MRFVDEFRQPGGIARLTAEIARLSEGRRVKLMEVCGGHTHAIYKHGFRTCSPSTWSWCTDPAAPSA